MRALKSILDSVGNYRVFLNVMMKGNVSAMSANPNPAILKGTWCNSFVPFVSMSNLEGIQTT